MSRSHAVPRMREPSRCEPDGSPRGTSTREVSDGRPIQSDAIPGNRFYPRFAAAPLKEALADTPVVLIHGPRQCGKTTLAQRVGAAAGYVYRTFDASIFRVAAKGYTSSWFSER